MCNQCRWIILLVIFVVRAQNITILHCPHGGYIRVLHSLSFSFAFTLHSDSQVAMVVALIQADLQKGFHYPQNLSIHLSETRFILGVSTFILSFFFLSLKKMFMHYGQWGPISSIRCFLLYFSPFLTLFSLYFILSLSNIGSPLKDIFFKNKVPTCIRITKNIHKQTATHLFSAAIERKIRRGPSSRGLWKVSSNDQTYPLA